MTVYLGPPEAHAAGNLVEILPRSLVSANKGHISTLKVEGKVVHATKQTTPWAHFKSLISSNAVLGIPRLNGSERHTTVIIKKGTGYSHIHTSDLRHSRKAMEEKQCMEELHTKWVGKTLTKIWYMPSHPSWQFTFWYIIPKEGGALWSQEGKVWTKCPSTFQALRVLVSSLCEENLESSLFVTHTVQYRIQTGFHSTTDELQHVIFLH